MQQAPTIRRGDFGAGLVLREAERLLAARREPSLASVTRVLLFADIVDSTARLVEMGDEHWAMLLADFQDAVATAVRAHGGTLIDMPGDGCFAAFEQAGDALRCAAVLLDEAGRLGLRLRAGVHAGECRMLPAGGLAGLAVHVGARIAALAAAGEVLVSPAVCEGAAESSVAFVERGEQVLRGVGRAVRLSAVRQSALAAAV